MELISTRNSDLTITPLEAVIQGLAPDGGLYVPGVFPVTDRGFIDSLKDLSYPELASRIIGLFFDIDDLNDIMSEAYSSFDTEEVAPVKDLGSMGYVMELYHGPTLAFKDMALQVLPRLMSRARKYTKGKDILILTATSGDTGKAALEGFADVEGTKIVVFFPNDGVSDMQKLQMVTQQGKNVLVSSVNGNFDDAQTAVKQVFSSDSFRSKAKGYRLSSANSINFGRLAPQIAYYYHAYVSLIRKGMISNGDRINFTVPTGNFGNILAGYYAKRMGLPVNRLICASNRNRVLTDFFMTGKYDSRREFFKTPSPSMDILISSNLERLIFELTERDSGLTASLMHDLSSSGHYEITNSMKEMLKDFYAGFTDNGACLDTVFRIFKEYSYLTDPHTAVAMNVYSEYMKETGDTTPNVTVSTASPFKFVTDVYASLTKEHISEPFRAAIELSSFTGIPVPVQIMRLKDAKIRFNNVINKEEMEKTILDFIR